MAFKMKNPCWDNYKMVGTKKKGGKTVPNCVPFKMKEGYHRMPDGSMMADSAMKMKCCGKKRCNCKY